MKPVSVRELTKDALSRVAPDEVFLVGSYDPKTAASGATAKGPQGFGAGDAIVLLLPFIYDFFQKFVEGLASETGKASFVAVTNWIADKSENHSPSARDKIRLTLKETGIPADAVEKTTDSIMETLNKLS